MGWCCGGCDCDFAVEAISYLFLFPVLLYIGCFFFFFSNLFFILINVVGLNNHLIPWPLTTPSISLTLLSNFNSSSSRLFNRTFCMELFIISLFPPNKLKT